MFVFAVLRYKYLNHGFQFSSQQLVTYSGSLLNTVLSIIAQEGFVFRGDQHKYKQNDYWQSQLFRSVGFPLPLNLGNNNWSYPQISLYQ